MNNYSRFWLEENEKINAFIIKAEYYDDTYCLKDKPIDTHYGILYYKNTSTTSDTKLIHLGVSRELTLKIGNIIVSLLNIFSI